MQSALTNSIVKVTSANPDNKNFGTGFILQRDVSVFYVVTSAHTLNDVGGDSQVRIDNLPARLLFSGFENDVDLSIVEVIGLGERFPLGLRLSVGKSTPAIVSGYQRFDSQLLISQIEVKIGKVVHLASYTKQSKISAYELRVIGEDFLKPGHSGAPLIDEISQNVVGVVSYRQGIGDKGVAITANTVAKIWPRNLPKIQINRSSQIQQPIFPEPPSALQRKLEIFVGRNKELRFLDEKIEEMFKHRGSIGFVMGDAGSGKTTLISEFSRRIRKKYPQILVAYGQSQTISGAYISYGPFKNIMEHLLSYSLLATNVDGKSTYPVDIICETVKAFGLPNASSLPFFLGIFSQYIEKRVFDDSNNLNKDLIKYFHKDLILDCYTKIIHNLSIAFPLLIVLDDLHWADESSFDLLLRLGNTITYCPIIILCAFRPEEATERPLLSELHSRLMLLNGFTVDLQMRKDHSGFDETEVVDFCKAYIDEKYCGLICDEILNTLVKMTGGNPLFISEILSHLEERKFIKYQEDKWTIDETFLSHKISMLPGKLELLMKQKIKRLDEESCLALKYASVEGETFSAQVISKIRQLNEESLLKSLVDKLINYHQILHEIGTTRLPNGKRLWIFSFNHILMHKYIYQYLLTKIEKEIYHAEVGEALESIWGEYVEQIAPQLSTHFHLANIPEKAINYSLTAAEMFIMQFGWPEVVKFARIGIRAWESNKNIKKVFDSSVLVKLRLLYAKAELEGGIRAEKIDHTQSGIEALEACFALLDEIDETLKADIYVTLGKLISGKKPEENPKANKFILNALKIYEKLDDKKGVISALCPRISETYPANQEVGNIIYSRRIKCLKIAEELEDVVLVCKSLIDLSEHYINFNTEISNPLGLAEDHALRALDISRKIDSPILEMRSQLTLSWVYHHLGLYGEKLESHRTNMVKLSRKYGQTSLEVEALRDLGHYYSFFIDTQDKSAEIMNEARSLRDKMGRHAIQDYEQYSNVLLRKGYFKECIVLLTDSLEKHDTARRIRSLGFIAYVQVLTEETEKALDIIKNIEKSYRKSNLRKVENPRLLLACALLSDNRRTKREAKKISKVLIPAGNRGMFHTYADYPTVLSSCYLLIEEFEKAQKYIKIAEQHWDGLSSVTNIEKLIMFWEYEFVRIKLLSEMGTIQEPLQFLQRVQSAFKVANHFSESEVYLEMGKICLKNSDSAGAKKYLEKSVRLSHFNKFFYVENRANSLLRMI